MVGVLLFGLLPRWKHIFALEIADDWDATAHADEPTFERVLLALLAVTFSFGAFEPGVVRVVVHDDPLVLRDVDHRLASLRLGVRPRDDRVEAPATVHHVLVSVGVVASVDTVGTVHLVHFARLHVTEVLPPADAGASTDIFVAETDAVRLFRALDPKVEDVGAMATRNFLRCNYSGHVTSSKNLGTNHSSHQNFQN